MRIEVGTQVDRYVVEGVLGSGGMAEVYAVRHATLGSPAALKVLRVRSPQLAVRLVREGKAQARLQHPNLVPVLDLFEIDGLPALVMERVEGPTLAQILALGGLTLPRIERLLRGIMLGLHEAHRLGIVHRDLKPSNVLVSQGEVPRIVDFGLATALADDSDHALTRPGSAIGTPAYMAPEQHEDAHKVDARADVFALGVVMYELLVGEAPAARCGMVAAWQKMSHKRWRPLSEAHPDLPARIERAVHWALEPDREQRAPSVAALWEAWFEEPFPVSLSMAIPDDAVEPVLSAGTALASAPEWPSSGGATVASLVPASAGPTPAGTASAEGPDAHAHARMSPAIPRASGALLGRQRDLALLTDALDAQGGLVTVVGTAGVGKTRLTIEAASRWQETRRPVVWVDLQSARDEQDLVQQVAWLLHGRSASQGQTMGSSSEASPEAIARTLGRSGALLLVLDNFEQLPRSASAIAVQWLSSAPSLRLLVTSRQPLAVPTEHTVEVLPLPLPASASDVADSPCWQLFAAAAPRGALEGVAPARMHALLQALDGLPLALELAAARLEVLGVDDLEKRLDDRFALLSDPGASGERHGALYDAIDWSWSLLGPTERRALAQLSAFVSPLSLEAAEAVLDVGAPVLDALHGLLRRSLIYRRGGRFSLLLSVREFAARKLEDMEEDQRRALWRRHAAWFGAWARKWQEHEIGTEIGLQHLTEASSEFAAALERALDDPSMVEDALSCALGRAGAFEVHGPMEGVLRTAEAAQRLADPSPTAHYRHLELRIRRTYGLRRLGRIEEAKMTLRALMELVPSDELLASICAQLADMTHDDAEQAIVLYSRALTLSKSGNPAIHVSCRAAMATTLASMDRYDEAQRLIQEALDRLPPQHLGVALEVHKARAWIATRQDAFDVAIPAYEQVRAIALRRGDPRGVLFATGQLGIVAHGQGDLATAEQRFAEAAAGMHEEGDPLFEGYWQAYHGRVLIELGRSEEGEAEIARVLRGVEGIDPDLRSSLSIAAGLGAARTRPDEAMRWGQAAALHPEVMLLPSVLARGFAALHAGDRAGAGQAANEARPMVTLLEDLPLERMARKLVDELAAYAGAWRIASDGAWVEPPTGDRIELQGANARIVLHLARRRLGEPGVATDAEGLAEAGWPGERIVPTAGGNRVRVALSTLRRQGLADLIERSEGGWRLAPEHTVQLV